MTASVAGGFDREGGEGKVGGGWQANLREFTLSRDASRTVRLRCVGQGPSSAERYAESAVAAAALLDGVAQ